MKYYVDPQKTLPNTGDLLKKFNWEVVKITLNVLQNTAEILVRCEPLGKEREPVWFTITKNNPLAANSVQNFIEDAEQVVTNKLT